MKLHFHKLALQEYEEAIRWYNKRSSLAASNFELRVDQAILRILEGPQLFPFAGEDYRRILVEKYPYSLIFYFTSDGIVILAVAHGKRRTGYWRNRFMSNLPTTDLF